MEIATRDDKKDFDRNGGNGSPFSRRYINNFFFFFFFLGMRLLSFGQSISLS